jgi:hypothetical protein
MFGKPNVYPFTQNKGTHVSAHTLNLSPIFDWPDFRSDTSINLRGLLKGLRMKINRSPLRSMKCEINALLHMKGYRPRRHNSMK